VIIIHLSLNQYVGKKWMGEDGVSYVIPFKLRGSKIIETMGEAFEAAKNMSKYLS